MIYLLMKDLETRIAAAVEIPVAHGPALRSALREIRNELGERASGAFQYDKEDAITRAISALGQVASVVNKVIPEEDSHYGG
jgi:hypothetical protein